ncbi:MAG: hypothetical protein ACWA5U_02270 [bacterium]
MNDCFVRPSRIFFVVALFTVLEAYLNLAQAAKLSHCTNLEHSSLPKQQAETASGFHAFALSHQQQHIALYQYFADKNLATLKLWNSQTGQLLQTAQLKNFEERSGQIELRFSPNDAFVYLMGMTYPKNDSTTGAVPFWHLADNRLIMSPCATAMGLTDLRFSTDHTVAYSRTIDGFHSLCHTQKAEQLASLWYTHDLVIFDPQRKHLSVNMLTKGKGAYQKLLQNIKKGQDKYISIYPSSIHQKQVSPASQATDLMTKPRTLQPIDQLDNAWLNTKNPTVPILHTLSYHQKKQQLRFCSLIL